MKDFNVLGNIPKLTPQERERKRYEIQKKTMDESFDLLMQYKRCIIIRPTGFGKTHIMAQIALKGIWDKVIFVYPREIIKKQVFKECQEELTGIDVEYWSYQRIATRFKKGKLRSELNDFSGQRVLFLLDEAHFCGAEVWYQAISLIQDLHPEFYYLGATATPDRPDHVNVVLDFFDERMPFKYTRHRAILDGILDAPIYVAGSFNIQNQIMDEGMKRIGNQKMLKNNPKKRKEVIEFLKKKVLEYAKYEDQSGLIRENIEKFIKDRDYMRFLVYFPTIKILESKRDEVMSWFVKAFPDMVVEQLTVVRGDREALNEMNEMERVEGKIDLIMCVDMISYGYHVDDLTGEVMLRLTKSDILLNQQVGRCYSITSNERKIIFDFIGNMAILPFTSSEATGEGEGIRIGGDGFNIYGDEESIFGDVISVNPHIVDIDSAIRFCDVDEIAMEKAVVRAIKYKHMPRWKAIEELSEWGVNDDEALDLVIAKYINMV